MRVGVMAAGAAALNLFVSAASADTITTTASTCAGDCFNWTSSLEPFDAGLGTLTGITLDVHGSKEVGYTALDDYDPVTNPTHGTGQLAYNGTMSVKVNGVTYSVNVSGADNVTINGPLFSAFVASGSASFIIDPAVFASFIDTADNCDGFIDYPPPGVCVDGLPGGINDLLGAVPAGNITGGARFEPIDAENRATYALTYTYIPALPEPASWAMMLLGFAVIGVWSRRSPVRVKSCFAA
jgi:hypothetical protein